MFFQYKKLTAQNYVYNMAVCKAEDANNAWFTSNNLEQSLETREYKKDLI